MTNDERNKLNAYRLEIYEWLKGRDYHSQKLLANILFNKYVKMISQADIFDITSKYCEEVGYRTLQDMFEALGVEDSLNLLNDASYKKHMEYPWFKKLYLAAIFNCIGLGSFNFMKTENISSISAATVCFYALRSLYYKEDLSLFE